MPHSFIHYARIDWRIRTGTVAEREKEYVKNRFYATECLGIPRDFKNVLHFSQKNTRRFLLVCFLRNLYFYFPIFTLFLVGRDISMAAVVFFRPFIIISSLSPSRQPVSLPISMGRRPPSPSAISSRPSAQNRTGTSWRRQSLLSSYSPPFYLFRHCDCVHRIKPREV